jgi:histidine triad (HIT) family protein
MRDGCPFCDYDGPSEILYAGTVMTWNDGTGLQQAIPYFVIEPISPVTPGHLLVVSKAHVPDFRSSPLLLGALMQAAADVAAERVRAEVLADGKLGNPPSGCNLIVSAGAEATQTVPHVHVHVVPRRDGDGLLLPWSA